MSGNWGDIRFHDHGSSDQTNVDSGRSEAYGGEANLQGEEHGKEKELLKGSRKAEKQFYKDEKKSVSGAVEFLVCKNPKPILIFPDDGEDVTGEKLQYIFGDVKDMPVAIYSISGVFRTGKSFLLNFLIKYLEEMEKEKEKEKEKGKPDYSWMDAKNSDLEGFLSKGGMNPKTQGILIYSKPFFIRSSQGQKVAVFLMDTQGMFDSETSVTKCSSIFALSTLISSVQIYNLVHYIREDNLQYLQLFTDYGRALQETARTDKGRKPFQQLLFLIRDWAHQTTGYGWEGGKNVMEKVLAVNEHANEDLKSVRQHIEDSFENVSCFLMPHPGRNIVLRKYDDQTFESHEMDEMFRLYLDAFVRDLFCPQKLTLKRIGGRKATGQNMIDFISGMLYKFNPKRVPHIGTLFQSAAVQTATKTLDECDELCRIKWIELKLSDTYFEETEIDSKGNEIEKKVLEKFHSHVLLGDQAFKDSFRKKMENRIHLHMLSFKQENEQTIRKHVEMYEKLVETAAIEFQSNLQKKNKNMKLFDHEKLEKHRVEIENEILNKFDKECPGKMKEKYRNRLRNEIQRRFIEISQRGFLEQTKIRRIIENLVLECFRKFKNEMSHELQESDRSKFTAMLETASTTALDIFDEKSKNYNQNFCDGYRNDLERRIKEYDDVNKAQFGVKKEQEKIQFYEYMKTAQEIYKNKSKLNVYLNDGELADFHETCRKAAEEHLQKCKGWDKEENNIFQAQLLDFYDNQWKFLQYKNEEIKNEEILVMKQSVVESTNRYKSEMAQVIMDETQQSVHEQKHTDALDRAVKEFDHAVEKIQHLETQKEEYRQELQHEITNQYNHNLFQLIRKEETAKKRVSNLLDKCLQTYTDHMSKRLQKAVSNEHFEELHEFASEQAQLRFDDSVSLNDETLKEKQKEELTKLIEEKKSASLEANKYKQLMGERLAAEHLQEALQFYQSEMRQKQAEYRIKERATELLNSCGRKLQEKVQKYVENEELSAFCDDLKNKTLQTFDENKSEGLLECFQTERGRLEKNLESNFKHVVGLNNQKMKELEIKVKEIASFAKTSFKEALNDISDQYFEHKDLEKRIEKEKKRVKQLFETGVRGIAEDLVDPEIGDLQKDIEKIATKIKNENSENQKHIETYAEFASNGAITHMKIENMKILNDQVDEDKARYRALEAVEDAMEKFEDGIEKSGKKFNARKYRQETKSALLRLKRDVIEGVRNQKAKFQTTKEIDSNGGVVEVGGCQLTIPENALLSRTEIKLTLERPDEKTCITPVLVCEPRDIQFHEKIDVTLPTCFIVDEDSCIDVKIQKLKEGGYWTDIDLIKYTYGKQIQFQTKHFCKLRACSENIDDMLVEKSMIFAMRPLANALTSQILMSIFIFDNLPHEKDLGGRENLHETIFHFRSSLNPDLQLRLHGAESFTIDHPLLEYKQIRWKPKVERQALLKVTTGNTLAMQKIEFKLIDVTNTENPLEESYFYVPDVADGGVQHPISVQHCNTINVGTETHFFNQANI